MLNTTYSSQKLTYALLIIGLIQLAPACNMLAVIANENSLLYSNQPDADNLILEEFTAFKNQGYNYPDGWSLLFYDSAVINSADNVVRSANSTATSDLVFDSTVSAIMSSESGAYIAIGHLRIATSGATNIPDPHPFIMEMNNRTFSFAHNGTLPKATLMDLLTNNGADSIWINLHPPATYGHGSWTNSGWEYVIDSELYFFWLMKNIEEAGGNILSGLETALQVLDQVNSYTGQRTFILSDGTNLYLYGSAHNLYYTSGNDTLPAPFEDVVVHHKAVMSEYPEEGLASNLNWIPIMADQIVILSQSSLTTYSLNTTIGIVKNNLPVSCILEQNYPNPFNSVTTIKYYLPIQQLVCISIIDLRGRSVRKLFNRVQNAGYHSLDWNASDDRGQPVGSGIYLYQIQSESFSAYRKMIFLK
ncbi:MAG: class II glutamine amidotransferase [Candidatus Marinimicrobia bacterium]|nr:class II glutamine amidotransferase [Candidatus Neomarinimicrobiota bacterium]